MEHMKISAFITTVVLGVLSLSTAAQASRASTEKCQCAPEQWSGVLASSEWEFDLEGGRTRSLENKLLVFYDYRNRKFAIKDLKTGNEAIGDYAQGYKYFIRDGRCRALPVMDPMTELCIPDDADYKGEHTVGTNIPVEMWSFAGPHNESVRTTVIQTTCVPITEEIFLSHDKYASLSSSTYLDVQLGISDRSVFEPPKDCSRVSQSRARVISSIINKRKPSKERISRRGLAMYGMIRDGMPFDLH